MRAEEKYHPYYDEWEHLVNEWGHEPVLIQEFLSFFKNLEIEVFVDGTLGAGGHSLSLLKAHPEVKLLLGFDQDQSALNIAKERLSAFKDKVVFIKKNFCEMNEEMQKRGIKKACGIFLDIGVSSMQLDQKERGFSFSKEGPLDMRMDRDCELTAEDVVNDYTEKELEILLREYGDLPRARFISQKIVEARGLQRITTTKQLVELLSPFLKKSSKKGIHPLTLVFQALRIEVNNELKVLSYSLPKAVSLLRTKGRMGVVSFHSGEDRIVKNVFRDLSKKENQENRVEILTKKPIGPSEDECHKNPRARSSKMRFVERV